MKSSKKSSSEKKNMQVEAKKAFEEYELYEGMGNGIKVRAKVSNVERERSKECDIYSDSGGYFEGFGDCCEGKEAI